MKDSIVKEQLFPHPIKKIWDAISKEEEISTWFIPAIFKAEKGYKYAFNSEGVDCSAITGEVLEATPYTLIYTWIVSEKPEAVTTVKWVLTPTDHGTKLYLEHSGISNYASEIAVEMFASFNGGWDNCMNLLTGYLKETVDAG